MILIKYTFVIENLMKGDLLTIVSVILIGYYVNNIRRLSSNKLWKNTRINLHQKNGITE